MEPGNGVDITAQPLQLEDVADESGTNRGRQATSAVDLWVGDGRPGRERRSSAGQHRRPGPRPPVLTPSSALPPTVCPALGRAVHDHRGTLDRQPSDVVDTRGVGKSTAFENSSQSLR